MQTTLTQRHASVEKDGSQDPLERLRSYRSAAQNIRREPVRLGVRLSKLIRLRQAASREPDPFVRSAAEGICWAQGQWLIEGEEALKAQGGNDPVERAARRLRASGRECCPTCEQRLTDPADWAWWAAVRRHELQRLADLDREPETQEAA
jgi:hypothetical protein